MRTLNPLVLPLIALALGACDESFLGDAEPDLDNPFTFGSTARVADSALNNPVSVIASQRWGGSLYAIANQNDALVHALDDSGQDQGAFLVSGLNRSNWQDLAVHEGHLLILDRLAGQVRIHTVAEPDSPPPFSGEQPVLRTQSVSLPGLMLAGCSAMGISNSGTNLTLLCGGGTLYTTPLASEDGANTTATEVGALELPASEIVDFSISPGGQYALLTTLSSLQVAQSDGSNWAQVLNAGTRQAHYGDADITPVSGSFAFNGVLLHALGRDSDSQGVLFSIFNP